MPLWRRSSKNAWPPRIRGWDVAFNAPASSLTLQTVFHLRSVKGTRSTLSELAAIAPHCGHVKECWRLRQHQVMAHRLAHNPSLPTKPAAETEDAEALTTETIATKSTCSARKPAALRLGSVQ